MIACVLAATLFLAAPESNAMTEYQKSRAEAAVGVDKSLMCGSSPTQSNDEQSSTRFSRKVKKDSMVS